MRFAVLAVAACLLLGGCALFGNSSDDDAPAGAPALAAPPGVAASPDVPPGGEKAVILLARGRELEKSNRAPEAEELYREALIRTDLTNVERAQFHLRLAQLLARTGRREDAGEHGREALRVRPGWDDAARFLERLEGAGTGGDDARPKGAKARKKDAAVAGDDADDAAAKKRAEKERRSGDRGLTAASEAELAGLRKKLGVFKETAHRIEMERDLLKTRVAELEREIVALRDESAALRARLEEAK